MALLFEDGGGGAPEPEGGGVGGIFGTIVTPVNTAVAVVFEFPEPSFPRDIMPIPAPIFDAPTPAPIFGGGVTACPEGSHTECEPCPPGMVCAAVCTPVCVSDIAVPSLPDLLPSLPDLLAPIFGGGGGGGGVGRALPFGTAGTRLVTGERRSPLLTILILVVIAGIGYFLYRRYRKGKEA